MKTIAIENLLYHVRKPLMASYDQQQMALEVRKRLSNPTTAEEDIWELEEVLLSALEGRMG